MHNFTPDGQEIRTRVYVKAKSKAARAVFDVLQSYGLESAVGSDGRGAFFDITLPAHWSTFRKGKFGKAIELAKTRVGDEPNA